MMDNPELYTENNQLQQSKAEIFLNFFGEKLRKEFDGKEIALLDIGSGCGRVLTEVVVGKGGLKFTKVIGVDKSEEMVKFSSEKYGSDLMSFQVMDVESKVPQSLKNQQFDMVTSFFCLPYCKDLNAAFQNIQNFLKPNGIFCCIFSQLSKAAKESQLVDSDDKHAKFMIKYRDTPNARLMDDPSEVIRSHLNENRMEVIELIDVKNDEFEFTDAEAARRLIEASIPKIKSMSDSERQEVVDKQFKMYEMKQNGDKFVFFLQNLYFIARKSGRN